MFRDSGDHWSFEPDGSPPPAPKRPNLSPSDAKLLGRLIGLNAVLLLVAPIGGSTLIHLVMAWLAGR